jgi:adenylate cyclase
VGALAAALQPSAVRFLVGLAALTLVILLGTNTWNPEWRLRMELFAHDWHVNAHLQHDRVDPRITIVDIDEASLAAVGGWPWPRQLLSRLVAELFDTYGARAVGLDIVFPDFSDADGDRELAAVADRYPLALAQAFDFSGRPEAPRSGMLIGGLERPASLHEMPQASGFVANHPMLSAARCAGHITPQIGPDGQARSIAPMIAYDGKAYPMLSFALVTCGQPDALPQWERHLQALTRSASMSVPYRLGASGYMAVSAATVLAGSAPREALQGRYILVGSSALGIGDRVATPIHRWLPGVVVHAELLGSLLDQQQHPRVALDLEWLAWLWALIAIWLLSWLFASANAKIALAALAGWALLWLLIADRLLLAGHILSVSLPLVPCAVFLFVQAPYEWATAQSQSRQLVRQFSKYLPPVMVQQLVRRRAELDPLRPVRREITILFADIRGYTALAEAMPPEQLAAILQLVLERFTRDIHGHEGTLDKYMGDALMAFWGAPMAQPDHADRALECAQRMLRSVGVINARLQRRYPGMPSIRICIGINSGEAVVGELGSTMRSAYTAIGDAVNLASRLQDHAKAINQTVLVGSRTSQLAVRNSLRELGYTVIRGRLQGDVIYVPQAQDVKIERPTLAA